jgi:hypothetical protein
VGSVIFALVLGAVVVVAALVLRRRRPSLAPTQPRHQVPAQLDRADFVRPDAPWLVAVFTSSTCHVCADVARKAAVLDSAEVAVQQVEYTAARSLHARYAIDAVPAVVVADSAGVVRASFLGPVTATDLWVSVAEARDPGSTPTAGGCQNHGQATAGSSTGDHDH